MPEETDSQLVARLLTGDVAAFEAIVGRHRATVVTVAAARLGSLEDAEDVAQEAFVQAYFRLPELRDPDALLPWLRRIADRLALMRLRTRREDVVDPERLSELAGGNSEDEMDGFGLPAALAELPVGMRQVVSLTYLAGYTCAEAAKLLGIKEGTVKSRLSRARAKLKEAFAMTDEELREGQPRDEFTQETVDRLMREARRLMSSGDVDGAARRANKVLDMQARQLFESGDDPGLGFGEEAARIAALSLKQRRRRDAEANAAQYGFTLEELDWEPEDIDMLEMTLGKPAGRGQDTWGVPRGRVRTGFKDSRDICRRLRCSPLTLSEWVDRGCPILRCWPFARFDVDRVRQWLKDSGITDWPNETDHDLDRPIRVIFKALHQQQLTPEEAERVMANLGEGDWG